MIREDLHNIPILSDFSATQLEKLEDYVIFRSYNPGELIFLEGDDAIGFWVVTHGRVRIMKQSYSGKLQGICMVEDNQCFGGCPMFDMGSYPASAQALDDVTLAIFPNDVMEQVIGDDFDLGQKILEIYLSRMSFLAHFATQLGTENVHGRINHFFRSVVEENPIESEIHLTHDEIATMVGTSREVVTRYLSELETQNIIETHSGMVVLRDMSFFYSLSNRMKVNQHS